MYIFKEHKYTPFIHVTYLSSMANGKKSIRTNNDLQDTTQKTKARETQTLLKYGLNSCAPEEQAVPAPLVTSVVLL